jgi:Virulence activator alpha C-term
MPAISQMTTKTAITPRYMPRDKVRALLLESETEHRKRLARYHEVDDHLARFGADAWSRATLSFGVHYEQAVVRWFESLPQEITGVPADGNDPAIS